MKTVQYRGWAAILRFHNNLVLQQVTEVPLLVYGHLLIEKQKTASNCEKTQLDAVFCLLRRGKPWMLVYAQRKNKFKSMLQKQRN